MKYLTFIIICTLTSFHVYPQTDNIKVITYNIWNGFDFGKDEERRIELRQWVNQQEPSIVALQELCNYTDKKLAEDAKSWGHDYSILLKTTGYSVGLTSKFPIVLKEKIRTGMHHGALHCKTNDIDIFVIHFSPSSYLKRREEAKIILKKLSAVRSENSEYMVLGDFNAHSPFDADLYDPDGPLLQKLRESNKDKPIEGNLFNDNLDYAVIASFLAFPLLDVCQPFTSGMAERGSFPGQVLGKGDPEAKKELLVRLERIDFILVSPELNKRCISAKVCNGEENHDLSDHYPVVAEFR
jgi:exodeoxyribonuclease-3